MNNETSHAAPANSVVGLIGILVALAGLGVALFQDDLRPAPPSAAERLADTLTDAAADMGLIEAQGEVPSDRDWVRLAYLALGFAGFALAVVSYARKEASSVSSVAGALGVMVMAWEYVLIGVAVGVVIIIILNFGEMFLD